MPNRIIRESCRTSHTLDTLSDFAERLFWRLTTVADDFGRFESHPAVLTAACFPLRCGTLKPDRIASAFKELVACGLVTTYVVNGKHYSLFNTWDVHQRRRARRAKHPSPPMLSDDSNPRSHDSNPRSDDGDSLQNASEESRNRGIEESRSRGIEESRSRGIEESRNNPSSQGSTDPLPAVIDDTLATPEWVVQGWNAIGGLEPFDFGKYFDPAKGVGKALLIRLKEKPKKAWWEGYFSQLDKSAWIRETFHPHLDWGLKPANIQKVLQGNYIKTVKSKPATAYGQLMAEIEGAP